MLKAKNVYFLEFVSQNRRRNVFVQPSFADLALGIVGSETFEDSGIMEFRLINGQIFKIPFASITNIYPYQEA